MFKGLRHEIPFDIFWLLKGGVHEIEGEDLKESVSRYLKGQ